ncbi:hypothetical protein [Neobacillus cucumis]|uniref:hypothetical protein n=1 Tax=Neobacillus cucumis TaxID=1740721 RepID=UPI002E1ADE6D|nr:hypothetical protein [Neobacillus cucumis]
MRNLYDKLSIDHLAQFYYHINNNIAKGILSRAMYNEISLIKKSVIKKGFCIADLDQFLKHPVN